MALRQQVISTDSVQLVNEKPLSIICKKEYTIENVNRLSEIHFSHFEARATLTIQEARSKLDSQYETKLLMAGCKDEDICKAPVKEDSILDLEPNDKSKTMGGDVLLQWGQRKRQRNGRYESKGSAAKKSSGFCKKSVKIMKSSTVVDKQTCSPRSLQPNYVSRGHSPRFHPAIREVSCTIGWRDMDTCSLSGSAGHNGCSIPADNALHKPSISFLGQIETAADCNGTINDGALAINAHGRADIETNNGEHPTSEKVDFESFEWPKFVIPLSRKEKEEDFLAIKGSKLPQRPKKHPKPIEKVLHYVSPGMWLSDLTRERYEVKEKKAVKKRPRGLKAMSSMDSDSE